MFTRRCFLTAATALIASRAWRARAGELADIEPQPYFAGVLRAAETLRRLGEPIADIDFRQLAQFAQRNDHRDIEAAEGILKRYTLARVIIEADGYARGTSGGADRTLVEQGWRLFLIRVSNSAGGRGELKVYDGARQVRSQSSFTGAERTGIPDTLDVAPWIAGNWLTAAFYDSAPMTTALSGFTVEYKVIQLFSRDRGSRSAELYFVTADEWYAGFAAKWQYHRPVTLTFNCLPSRDVVLGVRDTNGRGCVASVTITDPQGRVYPLQAMRLPPDLQFQPQIYRADGETVRLPDGEYTVESRRGPEYLRHVQRVEVGDNATHLQVALQRWIDPSEWGWYSGDTHIHAAGCLHFERPTEGVSPGTMIRQARGEGLAIGEVLTWGPSWYYQKQFFTGAAESPPADLEEPELQAANNSTLRPRSSEEDAQTLVRYDVEISGFPSSHCGHPVLLRLRDQDFPGTTNVRDWPSWNLPIMQWAKGQGGVVGYGHCGEGLVVDSLELPNYLIPPMDIDGANEAIVDATHGALDFLSGCDGPPLAELNVWYHLLNCGFRMPFVGETDYPCITGERPGVGRSYVRLARRPAGNDGYEDWIRGLQQGHLYCGDGRSHFLEFKVHGERHDDGDIHLDTRAVLSLEALVAARLEPNPPADFRDFRRGLLNGWHLENARIGDSRFVQVEAVVNGRVASTTTLNADGIPRHVSFTVEIMRSSWIALRIFPSAHTYPVFVRLGSKPIFASRRSAEWCKACVDSLWETKSGFIRQSERASARKAFDHARSTYASIAAASDAE